MPRYSNYKKRYIKYKNENFILDWLINRIMKNGKKLLAIKQLEKIFKFISYNQKENAYKVFLTTLYMVGPRIECYSLVTAEGPAELIEEELSYLDSAKIAINILLKNSFKRREKKFFERFALEVLDSYNGRSNSIKEKENIENETIKKITEQFELQIES